MNEQREDWINESLEGKAQAATRLTGLSLERARQFEWSLDGDWLIGEAQDGELIMRRVTSTGRPPSLRLTLLPQEPICPLFEVRA